MCRLDLGEWAELLKSGKANHYTISDDIIIKLGSKLNCTFIYFTILIGLRQQTKHYKESGKFVTNSEYDKKHIKGTIVVIVFMRYINKNYCVKYNTLISPLM